MQITGFAYQTFYRKLVEKLLDRCFFEERRKKIFKNSAEFWTLPSENFKKGEALFEIAYAGHSEISSPKYLYNKKSEYPLDFPRLGILDDLLVISCLDFMGYSLPKKIANPSFLEHEPVQAAVLFQFFAEEEMKDYVEKYISDFIVFNHETNSVIEEAFVKKRGVIKAKAKEISGDTTFEITEEEHLRFKIHRQAFKFIEDYFENLNNRNYLAAMDFWEESRREFEWKSDVKEFQRQYWAQDRIKLNHVYLENIDRDRKKFEVFVNCFEWVSYQTAKDFEMFLEELPIEESKKILKCLNSFLARSERNKFGLADQNFQSLFDYSVIDKMHQDAAYEQSRLREVLPENKKLVIHRFARCVISEADSGRWHFLSYSNIAVIREKRDFHEKRFFDRY